MNIYPGMRGLSRTYVTCEHSLSGKVIVNELADESEPVLKFDTLKLYDAGTRLVEDVEVDDGVVEKMRTDTRKVRDDRDVV